MFNKELIFQDRFLNDCTRVNTIALKDSTQLLDSLVKGSKHLQKNEVSYKDIATHIQEEREAALLDAMN